jgi:hypothetical protein
LIAVEEEIHLEPFLVSGLYKGNQAHMAAAVKGKEQSVKRECKEQNGDDGYRFAW